MPVSLHRAIAFLALHLGRFGLFGPKVDKLFRHRKTQLASECMCPLLKRQDFGKNCPSDILPKIAIHRREHIVLYLIKNGLQ
jgi:hypothetical protein